MLERSPREWARICRSQAALTAEQQTREHLLKLASDYDGQSARTGPTLSSLFYDEATGAFRDGHIVDPPPDATRSDQRNDDVGHWRCDFVPNNQLSWSGAV